VRARRPPQKPDFQFFDFQTGGSAKLPDFKTNIQLLAGV